MGENRTEVGLYTIKKVRQHENKGAFISMIFPEPMRQDLEIKHIRQSIVTNDNSLPNSARRLLKIAR